MQGEIRIINICSDFYLTLINLKKDSFTKIRLKVRIFFRRGVLMISCGGE